MTPSEPAAWVDPLTASEMSTRQTTSAVGEPDAASILRRAARWWRCHVQCRVCCHAICRCEPDDGMYGDWRDRPGNYGE